MFDKLKLNKFKTSELKLLEEYCLVLEPVVTSLVKLQGDKRCFLGYLTLTMHLDLS